MNLFRLCSLTVLMFVCLALPSFSLNEANALSETDTIENVSSFHDHGMVTSCLQLSRNIHKIPPARMYTITPQPESLRVFNRKGAFCFGGLEPDTSYSITLKRGIRLLGGEETVATLDTEIMLDSLPPSIVFKSPGHILSRGSAKGVELISTNVDRVALELVRVPERSLNKVIKKIRSNKHLISRAVLRDVLSNTATVVWKGSIAFDIVRNESSSSIIPIEQILDQQGEGVFALFAAVPGDENAMLPSQKMSDWKYGTLANVQWLALTDLGSSVIRFNDGLLVSVRSLSTAAAVAGASVQLITRNNDIVFEGTTGDDGSLMLPKPAVNGKRANTPSHLIVRYEKDFSWVSLQGSALDLSRLDLGGRKSPKKLDAFLYTDRGVYRPGETVYLSGLIRDIMGKLTMTDSLNLLVYRPNGSLYLRKDAKLSQLDALSQMVELPVEAPRGGWRFVLAKKNNHANELGSVKIDVQDFIPEKLKVELTSDSTPISINHMIMAEVQADFLFGAPASQLGVEAEGRVHPMTAADLAAMKLSDYSFGDELSIFKTRYLNATTPNTGVTGRSILQFGKWSPEFPVLVDYGKATQPVIAALNVGVQEPGGRTTKTHLQMKLSSGDDMIAIRGPVGGRVGTNTGALVDVRRFDKKLKSIEPGELKWVLQRMRWNWRYDRRDNRWSSRYELMEMDVHSGLVDTGRGNTGTIELPPLGWGRYMLTVYDKQHEIYTRHSFYSGWSNNAQTDTPDFLEVMANNNSFKLSGDIEIGLESPFSGQATVTVWANGLKHHRNITVTEGSNLFILKSEPDWFPGVYVVVSAFRPLHRADGSNPLSAQNYLPIRAMGSLYLTADTSRSLKVTLADMPILQSRQTKTLSISVPALAGKKSYAVVQAVDEGILQLTNFKTPRPEKHFFAKRALESLYYDDYNKLLRADGTIGQIQSGGDASAVADAPASIGGAALPVVPTKSVVLYSGMVELDANGNALVPLDIPDFNGTLRVMASVWGQDSFGSADAYWVVRDPFVAEAVLPRYISPGDNTTATIIFANTTDSIARATISLRLDGALDTKQDVYNITLAAGHRRQIQYPISASQSGTGYLHLSVATDSGFSVKRTYQLSSRYPGRGQLVQSLPATLVPQGKHQVSLAFADHFTEVGRSGYVQVGAGDLLNASVALRKLLSYRWTCSEQTVSKAWPVILAYNIDPEFVERTGIGTLNNGVTVQAWLKTNLDRILSRQSGNGAIGLWREGDGLVDPFLSTSLVGFLATAESAGFTLPPNALQSAYEWSYGLINDNRGLSDAEKVEILSSLVRGISKTNYPRALRLARTLAEQLDRADLITMANVAIALYRMDDRERYVSITSKILQRSKQDWDNSIKSKQTYYRTEIAIKAEMVEAMYLLGLSGTAAQLEEDLNAKIKPFYSVHEAGRILRAAVSRSQQNPVAVRFNGRIYQSKLGSVIIPLPEELLTGKRASMVIESLSDKPIDMKTSVFVLPKLSASFESIISGLVIDKQYFDLEGNKIADDWKTAHVNDRYVVVTSVVKNQNTNRMQILIMDPVPAGFEIETVLTQNTAKRDFPWIGDLTRVDVQEAHDDAFFAAHLMRWGRYNNKWGNVVVAYILRATTPGHYLPVSAVAENMYNAEIYGVSSARSLEVIAE